MASTYAPLHQSSLNPPPYGCSPCSPSKMPSSSGFFGSLKRGLTRRNSGPNSKSKSPSEHSKGQLWNSANMSRSVQQVPNEPPPAYGDINNVPVGAVHAAADNSYGFLSTFDTVFLIDDSGSMAGRSWRETKDALAAITPICTQYDRDGIDIHFLNEKDSEWYHNVKSAATVHEIFSSVKPRGQTPMGQRLREILKKYLKNYKSKPDTTKPLNIIVITDGEPTDDPEGVIIEAAKKLDALEAPSWQVGIQFFQVGGDLGAQEYLKQLDDELEKVAKCPIRDMVDTIPWTSESGNCLNAEGILKVVLGAVNRRRDRREGSSLYERRT